MPGSYLLSSVKFIADTDSRIFQTELMWNFLSRGQTSVIRLRNSCRANHCYVSWSQHILSIIISLAFCVQYVHTLSHHSTDPVYICLMWMANLKSIAINYLIWFTGNAKNNAFINRLTYLFCEPTNCCTFSSKVLFSRLLFLLYTIKYPFICTCRNVCPVLVASHISHEYDCEYA